MSWRSSSKASSYSAAVTLTLKEGLGRVLMSLEAGAGSSEGSVCVGLFLGFLEDLVELFLAGETAGSARGRSSPLDSGPDLVEAWF